PLWVVVQRSWQGGDGGEEGVVVVEVTVTCGRRDGDGVDEVGVVVVVVSPTEEESGVEWWLVWWGGRSSGDAMIGG
ncbi:hypothetical protein Tco_0512822, partial [Tanacetum coccineum]